MTVADGSLANVGADHPTTSADASVAKEFAPSAGS